MAETFNPKRVMRQLSVNHLEMLFDAYQIDAPVDWNEVAEDPELVIGVWLNLDDNARHELEAALCAIHDLATEDGIRALVEVANEAGELDLIDEMEEFESRHDKVCVAVLSYSEVWEDAARLAHADSLSFKYYQKRTGLIPVAPQTADEALAELAKGWSAFYMEKEGRGRYCKVEHLVRGGTVNYFFGYLLNYAETHVGFDPVGRSFERRPERRVFEIVVIYDRAHGTLETFARGGKKVIVPVLEIFCRTILGLELPADGAQPNPYVLNGLLDRSFSYFTEAEDGIESVSVRRLRLGVKGSNRRITLEADHNATAADIQDMIDDWLNAQRLPRSVLNVIQVGFRMRFEATETRRKRTLSFHVTYPNSCDLKSKPEAQRVIAEKYLRKWGLDQSQPVEPVLQAAGESGGALQ